MKNNALIFDIDGTLWNASPASARGWTLGLGKLGIDREISPEEVSRVAGLPYEQCVEILLPGMREKFPELLDVLNEAETEMVKAEGGKFYEGVLGGLLRLAGDYRLFLVSNCQDWYLRLFLDFSGIREVFSGFDCHGLSGLPKSEMLLNLKNKHSLINPVYIGDTAGDEAAAHLAGMEFIHAAWGFGRPDGTPKSVDSFILLMEYVNLDKNPKGFRV